MKLCSNPFESLEIHKNGECYPCCPRYTDSFSFGNIFKNSFDQIWNSKNAYFFREKILNGDYSLCSNRYFCARMYPLVKNIQYSSGYCDKGPLHIKFCHDDECNIACNSCRPKVRKNSDEKLQQLNNLITTIILPLGKNLQVAEFAGNGDPFASRHYRKCIQALAKEYPSCKFGIHSNGLLCDEKNVQELGLNNRIASMSISVDAATPDTYRRIRRGGDFYKLLDNLDWIASKRKDFSAFFLFFVVQSKNFREMPDFARMAKGVQATATFWPIYDWGSFSKQDAFAKANISEEKHPQFKELQAILEHPALHEEHVNLNELKYLTPVLYP